MHIRHPNYAPRRHQTIKRIEHYKGTVLLGLSSLWSSENDIAYGRVPSTVQECIRREIAPRNSIRDPHKFRLRTYFDAMTPI